MLKNYLCLVALELALGLGAVSAFAAPCQVATPTPAACVNQPTGSICYTWSTATTRETVNGITPVLLPSEIKNYEVTLNGVVVATPPGGTNFFIYQVPTNVTVDTSAVLTVATVDTLGQKSSIPFTCTLPTAVSGPKSRPAAPTGVTATAL